MNLVKLGMRWSGGLWDVFVSVAGLDMCMRVCLRDLQFDLRAGELEVERLALQIGCSLASDLLVEAEDIGRRESWEGAGLGSVGPGDDGVVELLGDARVVCPESTKLANCLCRAGVGELTSTILVDPVAQLARDINKELKRLLLYPELQLAGKLRINPL